MRLSILIPSIPSRFDKAINLYNDISKKCEDLDIEILMLTDNKKRTIGEKREALKNISNGKYFMFVDDDDSLLSVKEIYDAAEHFVDVITFKQRSLNSDGSTYIVTFGLGNEIEHNTEDGRYLDCKRPPFHVCAWAAWFKHIPFPAINYGEDGVWVEQALRLAKSETHIDKVLHSYNFNPEVSEASTVSNQHWKSPNEKSCVVNFSTVNYYAGQRRLQESITDIDFIALNEYSLLTPQHRDNNYAFKVYSVDYAKESGYTKILWLDASVWAIKSLQPVFELINKNGFFVEDSGHKIGMWSNDRTLEYYGMTREEAMQVPMISSGFVGFDFNNRIGVEIFNKWKKAMQDGQFNGSWEDHRHDQTCLSIIIIQMGLEHLVSPGGHFFGYVGEPYGPTKQTAICYLQGL